jgi:hypothetical protein
MFDLRTLRSFAAWRDAGLVILVAGVVILASMALVSLRNRHRAARSVAIEWAIEALHQVPPDTVAAIYPVTEFANSVEVFHQRIRANEVPVDSVREFYQLYARGARDGSLAPGEIAEIGTYLGLTFHPQARDTSFPSSPSSVETTGESPGP